ncbi:MAG TPA: polymer-forming cytoskeletal protein [Steroidobacteraceae bacterium]|nr:polymer-forming cytoskeletal protein [Steroidobacteraceae bacterium]
MAFFKDTAIGPKDSIAPARDLPHREPDRSPAAVPVLDTPRRTAERAEARAEGKESFIAAELTIDGKIEGVGSVRIAGRFKGDVQVQGNLTLDSGAHLTGQVKARHVTVSGELHGNIDGAQRVELLDGGVLVGDVKAGSLTVASGSRMRGQVEFGWDDKGAPRPEFTKGNGSGG